MQIIAVIRDGRVSSPEGTLFSRPRSQTRAVVVSDRTVETPVRVYVDEIDEIATLLARAVRLAQGLKADDQRRVRELFAAAHSLLGATTRLEKSDQTRFDKALRNAGQ